jgi:putative membrane protein
MSKPIVHFLLASSFTLCTACGGSSKSSDTSTTTTTTNAVEPAPVAETPEERQPVAGETHDHAAMGAGSMDTAKPAPETMDKAAPAPEPMTDPNVFAMLTAANEHEIAVSKLALEKSKNKDVKKVAQMMIKDHTAMLEKGGSVAKKANVSPADNDDVTALRDESKMALEKLQGLDGDAFDAAFMDQMVMDHEKVLSAIDGKLMPAAQMAETKTLLEGARPKVAAHLEHVKKVQEKLRK